MTNQEIAEKTINLIESIEILFTEHPKKPIDETLSKIYLGLMRQRFALERLKKC